MRWGLCLGLCFVACSQEPDVEVLPDAAVDAKRDGSSTQDASDGETDAGDEWLQGGFLRASNAARSDHFGRSVSLSADGTTLAVGACQEDSAAVGINGDQQNDGAENSGAVYVFRYSDGGWSQQAYIKASNTNERDLFGLAVSLSSDGTALAVGTPREQSAATDLDGNQNDNSADQSGAVYVFRYSDGAWSQEAYIKASNTDSGDHFGHSVSLSSDGKTLAVGADQEDSASVGINGSQDNDGSTMGSGAVFLFRCAEGAWSQEAYIKASNTGASDGFGQSLSLSSDGTTLAVGAHLEDSATTGIDGGQPDDFADDSGAVYVFHHSDGTWSQQAYIKASNTNANDYFGYSVSLSSDGSLLAIGAYLEDSATIGVDGDQTDNRASDGGATYLFRRSDVTWSQEAYFKASNTDGRDHFGTSVSLSPDGNALAVGAQHEDSAATGSDGDQSNENARDSGAVYLFRRAQETWIQESYIKASNTDANDEFGTSVSLSTSDLAVGAGQAYNTMPGAAYVFQRPLSI